MAKGLMYKGMLLGAIVGGSITLLDRTTRKEVITGLKKTKNKTFYYLNHPSVYMGNLRMQCESATNTLLDGMNTTIKLINKVQETLEETENKSVK
ncbi:MULTISPECIES: hypothetical protein [Paraliobacillus]|uniref:hypothetical protein n=1 Tax=Paraliobacillus TaxID=200903 RepID=UPI000DD3230B|nr:MULTISPECIES: hypothetical protein [Paraliobacillus]